MIFGVRPDFLLKSSLSCYFVRLLKSDSAKSAVAIPLSSLPTGREARVLRLDGQGEVCQRLREIGFCESAVISRIAGVHTLVCQVCGTRVAVNHLLAQQIHVEPLSAAS